MARTDPQVNIRIPADLKDQLENAALENMRSFKGEIVFRLERFDALIDDVRRASHNAREARRETTLLSMDQAALIAERDAAKAEAEALREEYKALLSQHVSLQGHIVWMEEVVKRLSRLEALIVEQDKKD